MHILTVYYELAATWKKTQHNNWTHHCEQLMTEQSSRGPPMQLKRIENNAGNILMSLNTILSEKKKKEKESIQQTWRIFRGKNLPRAATSDWFYHNLHIEKQLKNCDDVNFRKTCDCVNWSCKMINYAGLCNTTRVTQTGNPTLCNV